MALLKYIYLLLIGERVLQYIREYYVTFQYLKKENQHLIKIFV
jgi:hypothetical protein